MVRSGISAITANWTSALPDQIPEGRIGSGGRFGLPRSPPEPVALFTVNNVPGPASLLMNLRQRRATHEAGHCVAAITFAIPIIGVTIAVDVPHLHRGRYRPPHDAGLECVVTLCLSGSEAEREYCGPITDGSEQIDFAMARAYLGRQFDPLQIGGELSRCRDAAQRLIRSPWGRQRITVLADALLRHGTLSAEEVAAVAG
jgi:hypothetical protein